MQIELKLDLLHEVIICTLEKEASKANNANFTRFTNYISIYLQQF